MSISREIRVNAGLKEHYVYITVHKKFSPSQVIQKLAWTGLPWEVRTKWDWYFKYRAALAQVQNPRAEVVMHWGHKESTGDLRATQLKNLITGKKRTITKTRNLIQLAKENWNTLFPIEDDEMYRKAQDKLGRLVRELAELESELVK